jgi:hypothetical protein
MKICQKKRIILTFLLIVISAASLSGCMNILAEDLYSLPQMTDEYIRLQAKIDEVLEQGAVLAPPVAGINRQAIQFRDLDGDGINEALVFFSIPDRGVLSLHIFTFEGGNYSPDEIIELRGIAFDRVIYVDMDGDGFVEIAIGRQINLMLRRMEIFSIGDYSSVSLAQADYIDFIDFDLSGDGNNDIILVSPFTQGGVAAAVSLYKLIPNGMLLTSSATLSDDIVEYVQILTGRLIDDTPAIFVESEVRVEQGQELITEIFIFYNDNIVSTTIN